MKTLGLILCVILLCTNYTYAQKVNLKKWVAWTVDSLQRKHVDTIEYYHAYCGECEILYKDKDERRRNYCETESSWVQVENIIVYQQNGKYYSLTFNCSNPSIKKDIGNVLSIPYFLSIIPVLNKRDKFTKAIYKQHHFLPLRTTDGGYEEAVIYCKDVKQSTFLQNDQKTDTAWRAYFWVDKETELFKLIAAYIH